MNSQNLNYVNAKRIEDWAHRKNILRSGTPVNLEKLSTEQLVELCNDMASSALLAFSNYVYGDMGHMSLTRGMATGCRCGGCDEWHIVDLDGKVLDSADTLAEFVNKVADTPLILDK